VRHTAPVNDPQSCAATGPSAVSPNRFGEAPSSPFKRTLASRTKEAFAQLASKVSGRSKGSQHSPVTQISALQDSTNQQHSPVHRTHGLESDLEKLSLADDTAADAQHRRHSTTAAPFASGSPMRKPSSEYDPSVSYDNPTFADSPNREHPPSHPSLPTAAESRRIQSSHDSGNERDRVSAAGPSTAWVAPAGARPQVEQPTVHDITREMSFGFAPGKASLPTPSQACSSCAGRLDGYATRRPADTPGARLCAC
jgi:hypothetical protein